MVVNSTNATFVFSKKQAPISTKSLSRYSRQVHEESNSVRKTRCNVYGYASNTADYAVLGMTPSATTTWPAIILVGLFKGAISLASLWEDCPDINSEEIKKLLTKKSNELSRKLVESETILWKIHKTVINALSEIEEIRKGMSKEFQRVVETIETEKIKKLIMIIHVIGEHFESQKKLWSKLSNDYYINNVILGIETDDLYNLVKKVGSLYNPLFSLLTEGYAVPKNIGDEVGFNALFALIYGTNTYITIVLTMLEQHLYVAKYYHKRNEFDKFNIYLKKFLTYSKEFKHILIEDKGFVESVLEEIKYVKKEYFIEFVKIQTFKRILLGEEKLKMLRKQLQNIDFQKLEVTVKNTINVDFISDSNKRSDFIPFYSKCGNIKIRYALQNEINGTFSALSEWTDPKYMIEYTNSKVTVERNNHRRYVYRKIADNKPELVRILESHESYFADIDRDFYNLAENAFHDFKDIAKSTRILIKNGANVSAIFERDRRPIHVAAIAGKSVVLQQILNESNETLNVKDIEGNTALHLACLNNKIDSAKVLIDRGADINAENNLQLTPLHIAVHKQSKKITSALLNNKDVNINSVNDANFTPLHFAVSSDAYNSDIIKMLLLKKNISPNRRSEFRLTPLHLAAVRNLTDAVLSLTKHDKTNVDARSEDGMGAIHFAAMAGHVEIVKLLLNTGKVQVNSTTNRKNWTPLHFATYFKKNLLFKELLEYNDSTINSKTADGITSLHMATNWGQKDMVESLLQKGADVNVKTNEGFTPLHLASMREKTDITVMLLSKKANIDALDNKNSSALHLAAYHGNYDNFALLFYKGADIYTANSEGNLPFHEAIRGGNVKIVNFLLKKNPTFIINEVLDFIGNDVMDEYYLPPIYFAIENIHKHGTEMYEYIKLKSNLYDLEYGNDIHEESFLNIFAFKKRFPAMNYLLDKGMYDEKIVDGKIVNILIDNGNYDLALEVLKRKLINLDNRPETYDLHKINTFRYVFACNAVKKNSLELLYYLDNNDLDINNCDSDEFPRLVKENQTDIVEYLVKYKKMAIRNAGNLLCSSLSKGYSDMSLLLLNDNTNPNTINCIKEDGIEEHNTPLKLAFEKNLQPVVRKMIEQMNNVNEKDILGNTPLSYAAKYNDIHTAKFLIDYRMADNSDTNQHKSGALRIAAENDHIEFIKYLISEGTDVNDSICGLAAIKAREYLQRIGKCNFLTKRNLKTSYLLKRGTMNTNQLIDKNNQTQFQGKPIDNKMYEIVPANTKKISEGIQIEKTPSWNFSYINSALFLLDFFIRRFSNKKNISW